MDKKIMVLISSALVFILLSFYQKNVLQGFCDDYTLFICSFYMYQVVSIKNLFGIILLFSSITIKLPQTISDSWWRFARVAIPSTLFLVLLINLGWHHSTGGFFNMDNDFDRLYFIMLYSFFTLGSIIQIYRGWRKHKQVKKLSK